MAKLVLARSPSSNITYYVNVEHVIYVEQAKSELTKCEVYFGRDVSLTLGISAEEFVSLSQR